MICEHEMKIDVIQILRMLMMSSGRSEATLSPSRLFYTYIYVFLHLVLSINIWQPGEEGKRLIIEIINNILFLTNLRFEVFAIESTHGKSAELCVWASNEIMQ